MDKLNNDILKDSLSQTKLEASENLKHRIMQQIETEHSLVRKIQKKRKTYPIESLVFVMAFMYAIIGLSAFYIYYISDMSDKNSIFGMLAAATSCVSVMILFITMFDNKRLNKKQ